MPASIHVTSTHSLNREHDGHLPSACGNHDRRGTLACGSRFTHFAEAALGEPPYFAVARVQRVTARASSPGSPGCLHNSTALPATRRPVRVETRWEQAVVIAGQTRRRPASRRGVGGPHASCRDPEPEARLSGLRTRVSERMGRRDLLSREFNASLRFPI